MSRKQNSGSQGQKKGILNLGYRPKFNIPYKTLEAKGKKKEY